MTEVVDIRHRRALKLIEQGLVHFSKGEVEQAARCFRASAEIVETAEAFTYWGWMLSFSGELEEAIRLCEKAIALDADFGNPYNDIGTYLMKMGRLRDAVPWLEKAKLAKRYEPRQYPHLNLGRIYLSQGMFRKALGEFEEALKYDPGNTELRAVIARIQKNHPTG